MKSKGEKERTRRRKGAEEKKAMVALLVFIIATLERVFGRKKLFDAKGPFGDYVIKNPARFKLRTIFFHSKIGVLSLMAISTSTYWIKVILELYRSKEKYVVYLGIK